MVTKKCQENFSFTAKHKPKFLVARWKILVTKFSFKNQNEGNMFGGTIMVLFLQTNETSSKQRLGVRSVEPVLIVVCF